MNIRTRLLLLVVAVWLPAVGAFALLAWWSYDQAEDAARTGIRQLGDNISRSVERELDLGMPPSHEHLLALLRRTELPAGAIVSVADGQRRVMARTRDQELWLLRRATGPVADVMAAARGGFVRSVTLDGVASLTYVSRPDRHGWVTVVALPAAALRNAALDVSWRLVAASAALLGIGLLAALVLARRITRPLQQLHQAAIGVAHGDVPPAPSTGLPEADAIGAALHRAASAHRNSEQALEHEVRQALQQAQQAQAKLFEGQKREAMGRLTGGIAHDFNNLLQTISVGLQLIERSVTDAGPRRALQAATRACGKAAELIRQMLTFGRSQSLAPRALPLDDFVLKALELTTKAVGPRIELAADIPPGLPPAWADPTELELALLNLIFNARDAMPDGGRILISARGAQPGELPARDLRGMVCLEVADTGGGMDAATLARATEPFFTTKPVGSGSGLGLAQVQWFARNSGGELVLHSTPGAGTRACIYLPAGAPAGVEEPVPSIPQQAAHEPLHVLMVEDDVLVAGVVRPALENAGHRVTTCHDVTSALQRLRAGEPFDVLLTDIVMPGPMDGSDLVQWCLENRPGLPCVVATGYSERGVPPGVALLAKPYAIELLLDTLAAAARGRRAESGT